MTSVAKKKGKTDAAVAIDTTNRCILEDARAVQPRNKGAKMTGVSLRWDLCNFSTFCLH